MAMVAEAPWPITTGAPSGSTRMTSATNAPYCLDVQGVRSGIEPPEPGSSSTTTVKVVDKTRTSGAYGRQEASGLARISTGGPEPAQRYRA